MLALCRVLAHKGIATPDELAAEFQCTATAMRELGYRDMRTSQPRAIAAGIATWAPETPSINTRMN
jgi:hypothetical protein